MHNTPSCEASRTHTHTRTHAHPHPPNLSPAKTRSAVTSHSWLTSGIFSDGTISHKTCHVFKPTLCESSFSPCVRRYEGDGGHTHTSHTRTHHTTHTSHHTHAHTTPRTHHTTHTSHHTHAHTTPRTHHTHAHTTHTRTTTHVPRTHYTHTPHTHTHGAVPTL